MPQNPQEVTNPDLVDVADQGDGPLAVDQSVLVTPTSSLGETAATPGLGGGVTTVTNPDLVDVADQAFNGLPRDVNVG